MTRGLTPAEKAARLEARFWAKTRINGTCIEWTGATAKNGYGRVYRNGHWTGAHRHAYELKVGPIPEGLDLDHLCSNRACINPGHLEPVTRQENLRRGDTPIGNPERIVRDERGRIAAWRVA